VPHTPPNIFTAQFPWAQLTYLNLGVPLEVIAARTILAQCVNLVDGSLWGLLSSEDDSAPPDLVTLPNLRRFLFGSADERVTVHTLFDALILPALRTLQIDDNCTGDTPYLRDLQTRSHFPLQELVLECCKLRTGQLLVVLRQLPTLRELRLLHCCAITNSFLKALTYLPDPTAPMLPVLETLELECHSQGRCSAKLVADMIESRSARGAWKGAPGTVPLKRVLVFGLQFSDEALRRRFKQMTADGLLAEDPRW
jgi:hypothetical protein